MFPYLEYQCLCMYCGLDVLTLGETSSAFHSILKLLSGQFQLEVNTLGTHSGKQNITIKMSHKHFNNNGHKNFFLKSHTQLV